jgi:ferric-dicitrate binding protein FerR (iron transport regulator)
MKTIQPERSERTFDSVRGTQAQDVPLSQAEMNRRRRRRSRQAVLAAAAVVLALIALASMALVWIAPTWFMTGK